MQRWQTLTVGAVGGMVNPSFDKPQRHVGPMFQEGILKNMVVMVHLFFKNMVVLTLLKIIYIALAGVVWWIECWTANQRVAGSIPSQGTCLG